MKLFLKLLVFSTIIIPVSLPAALTLVDGGNPRATIVISHDAPHKNKLAAEELQTYLKRISGAELPIVTDDREVEGNRILIGRSKATDELKIDLPDDYSFDEIREYYILRVIGNNLILAGNDGGFPLRREKLDPKYPYRLNFGTTYKGSLFAVYDFLERLGCRWFMPGASGEVVPQMKTIEVEDLNITEKPFFLLRGYWNKGRTPEQINEEQAFFHRNRFLEFHAGFANASDASIHSFISEKEYLKDHPEYFGLKEDRQSRDPHVICLSHPGVEKILITKIREHFIRKPRETYVGFAPQDGMPLCYCDNCRELNGNIRFEYLAGHGKPCISGSYFRLISNVASALKDEFPDKIISASIYAGRTLPPPSEFRFADNVGGHLALLEFSLMRPISHPDNWEARQIAALVSSWKKRLDKFVYRPYYPPFMLHCNLPLPMVNNIISDARFLARPENKPLGVRWECWPSWNTHFINMYVWGKMLWNPATDTEALLKDFYEKYYGPAAGPMKKFYTAIENAIVNAPFNTHEEELLPEIFSNKFVKSLMPYIEEAGKAASQADPATRQHIELAMLTAKHMLLYSEMRDICERSFNYPGAIERAGKMLELEEAMLSINLNYIDRHMYIRDERSDYEPYGANFSPLGKKKQYTNILKLINGEQGELAVKLPDKWKFKTDLEHLGYSAGWFGAGTDISRWSDIEIGRCIEVQGYNSDKQKMIPYLGEMWYAVDFELPERFRERDLALFVGGINNEAWIWLNGRIAAYQPFHENWNRTKYSWTKPVSSGVLKPGKNRITIRVIAGDPFGFGGIFRNIFIYTPNHTGEAK
jgi:hypothetical protein